MVIRVEAGQRWWPSPFGEDDQLGMLNHIDDAKRRAAMALVRTGRLYEGSADPGRNYRSSVDRSNALSGRRSRNLSAVVVA
jgi:hypothetical protein